MVKNKINGYSLLLTGNFAFNYSNIFGTTEKDKRCGKCSPKKDITSSDASELEEKQKKQENKMKNLENNINDLLNKIKDLKSENFKNSELAKFNEEENRKKIAELNSSISNLNTELTNYQGKYDVELKKITDDQKNELKDLKEKQDTLANENKNLFENNKKIETELEGLKKQHEEKFKELLEANEAQKGDLQTQLNDLTKVINNKETQYLVEKKKQEEKNKELEEAIEKYNEKNVQVYSEVNKMKSQVESLKELTEINKNKIDLLNKQINNTDIKSVNTENNKQINFILNTKEVVGTKPNTKYSYNSIVFLTEQVKKLQEIVSGVKCETKEEKQKLVNSVNKFFEKVGDEIAENVDFNYSEHINDLKLQVDMDIKNMKLSEFLNNFIFCDNAIQLINNFIANSYSAELYFDDIFTNKKTYYVNKPSTPKKDVMYKEDIKDYFENYNKKQQYRLSYDDIVFSNRRLDMVEYENPDDEKILEEREKIDMKIDDLEDNIEKNNNQIEVLKKQIGANVESFLSMVRDINFKKETIRDYIKENKDLTIKLNDLTEDSDDYKDIQGDISVITARCKALYKEIKDIEDQINDSGFKEQIEQIITLEDEISKFKKENGELSNYKGKMPGTNPEMYILKYINSVLYSFTDKKLSDEQITEITDKYKQCKSVEEGKNLLFQYIIEKFGNENIKDGDYHIIFYKVGELDFDSFEILRSNPIVK